MKLSSTNRTEKGILIIRSLAFLVLVLAIFMTHFHRNTPGVMRDELTLAFQLSPTNFGVFSSIYFYPYMIAQIPMGLLLDSIGIRKTIGISSLVAAVGSLIFGLSTTFTVACIGRIIISIGVAAPVLTAQKWVVNWFSNKRTTTYYGLICALGKLGALGAQFPLALLLNTVNWKTVFFAAAIVSVIVSISGALVVRNNPKDLNSPGNNTVTTKHETLATLLKALGRVFCNRYIWLALLFMFLLQGMENMFSTTWAVPYLQDVFQLTNVEASKYTTVMQIGAIFFNIFFGILSDRIKSRKKIVIAVAVILTIDWMAFTLFGNFLMSSGLMWFAMFLYGSPAGCVQILFAYSREMNHPKYVGISVSAINVVGMLGSCLFPVIFGAILEKYTSTVADILSYRHASMICLVVSIVCIVISIFLKETHCTNQFHKLHPES